MNVTKLADAVLRDLQILPGEWSLHWADPLRLAEGGLLCLDASSGWASLAAGLIVAMRGGAPRPDVWATGSWKWPDGISSVRGLEVKLRFAVEQGAAAFFVPASQVTEARNLVQHQALQIGPLIGGQRDPLRALREYLWTLELPPEMTNEPDGLARCSDYFLRIPAEKPAEMHEFYRKTLLPALARRLREQVRNEWSDWSPTHLITIVSGSPDLVRLVARALRISRCLLLHTADFEHYCAAMELRADLMADAVDCQLGALPGQDGFSESMGPPIREFLVNVPAQQVVFDMTPGTKRMTLALSQFVRSTNWNVYVSHSISADRRPIPGTERLLRWNGRD